MHTTGCANKKIILMRKNRFDIPGDHYFILRHRVLLICDIHRLNTGGIEGIQVIVANGKARHRATYAWRGTTRSTTSLGTGIRIEGYSSLIIKTSPGIHLYIARLTYYNLFLYFPTRNQAKGRVNIKAI